MYSLYSIVSISHNAETNHATWLATSGASITSFRTVGTAKGCPADRAVLLAVGGALDSLAKKFAGHITPGGSVPIHLLVPTSQWADRLNALDNKPLLVSDRDLLGIIAGYKQKANLTFFSSIDDVPADSILAKAFKGWALGWN